MSTSSRPPPKRNSSLEMTAVRPGPRVSLSSIASLDLDPNHPETHELMRRAQAGNEEEETKDACPACRGCLCCGDTRMVTPSRAAEWRQQKKDES